MSIIVIGRANMDIVMRTSRIPRIGETMTGEGFFVSPGPRMRFQHSLSL